MVLKVYLLKFVEFHTLFGYKKMEYAFLKAIRRTKNNKGNLRVAFVAI